MGNFFFIRRRMWRNKGKRAQRAREFQEEKEKDVRGMAGLGGGADFLQSMLHQDYQQLNHPVGDLFDPEMYAQALKLKQMGVKAQLQPNPAAKDVPMASPAPAKAKKADVSVAARAPPKNQ